MAILTTDWLLDAYVFAAVLALALYLYITRNSNYWSKRGVKDVPPSFFFGNVAPCIFAKKSPQMLLDEIYKDGANEKMIGFYVLDKPYLLLRDRELIKHVFIKDFANFSNKILCGNESDILGSTNLFLATNPPWKHIRQKLTPIFTSGKLKKMYELMMEICQDFEVHLDQLNVDDKIGNKIEIKEICAKLTTDLIGTTAFGLNFNSLRDPDAEFRKQGREMFRSTLKRYLQMLSIFFIPQMRSLTNAKFFDAKGSEFLRHTFWDVINNRTKSGIKRADLIDLLIDIKKNQDNNTGDNEFKLEGDALVAQAAVFFSGGFETSSTTMSFALYELARNPDVQTRLRNEISEALKETGGKPTYDMVTKLPYLDMVLSEALRMYPILAWIDRKPEFDYTFSGTNITIQKDVPVIIPMRSMHMDPEYFPNPNKFDPERFNEENKKNIAPFSYFPFGEGPRNCIGGRLGLIQTKLGIIYFISKFELSCIKDSPVKLDKLNVFTQSAGGVYLNLRKLTKV